MYIDSRSKALFNILKLGKQFTFPLFIGFGYEKENAIIPRRHRNSLNNLISFEVLGGKLKKKKIKCGYRKFYISKNG